MPLLDTKPGVVSAGALRTHFANFNAMVEGTLRYHLARLGVRTVKFDGSYTTQEGTLLEIVCNLSGTVVIGRDFDDKPVEYNLPSLGRETKIKIIEQLEKEDA